ncbi:MAG: hypothetical protein LC138_08010, partial [Anaerolineales bacterium]|nr:hypothetical protein [Anaerolineales bacterium]
MGENKLAGRDSLHPTRPQRGAFCGFRLLYRGEFDKSCVIANLQSPITIYQLLPSQHVIIPHTNLETISMKRATLIPPSAFRLPLPAFRLPL